MPHPRTKMREVFKYYRATYSKRSEETVEYWQNWQLWNKEPVKIKLGSNKNYLSTIINQIALICV